MHLTLNNIGDGLFQQLYEDDHILITDLGSQQTIHRNHIDKFFFIQESGSRIDFALTHFHKDHYSGLFEIVRLNLYTNFHTVYLPRLPQQPEAQTLFFALLTMQMFTMGSYSGSMDFDFLLLVQQLNRSNFLLRPLSQGDQVLVNGKPFHVSWPPRQFSNSTLIKIRQTLREFEAQIEEIRSLRDVYQRISECNTIWIMAEGGELSNANQQRIFPKKFDVGDLSQRQRRNLSRLNRKIRNAANCLSLCYYNDQLNFLGDLESAEIDQCIQHLTTLRPTLFWENIILPHHGTHWHDSMNNLSGLNGLSSNGRKMISHWDTRNRNICCQNFTTHIDGQLDLIL